MQRSRGAMIALVRGVLATVVAAAAMQAAAQPAATSRPAVAPPPGSVDRGEKVYVGKMCYTCHGFAGQGGERGSGPRIAPEPWAWEAFVQQVRRPRADMPRYPAKFVSDQDLADMYAFLSAIKRGAGARDIPLLRD